MDLVSSDEIDRAEVRKALLILLVDQDGLLGNRAAPIHPHSSSHPLHLLSPNTHKDAGSHPVCRRRPRGRPRARVRRPPRHRPLLPRALQGPQGWLLVSGKKNNKHTHKQDHKDCFFFIPQHIREDGGAATYRIYERRNPSRPYMSLCLPRRVERNPSHSRNPSPPCGRNR